MKTWKQYLPLSVSFFNLLAHSFIYVKKQVLLHGFHTSIVARMQPVSSWCQCCSSLLLKVLTKPSELAASSQIFYRFIIWKPQTVKLDVKAKQKHSDTQLSLEISFELSLGICSRFTSAPALSCFSLESSSQTGLPRPSSWSELEWPSGERWNKGRVLDTKPTWGIPTDSAWKLIISCYYDTLNESARELANMIMWHLNVMDSMSKHVYMIDCSLPTPCCLLV